jgi:hypothetical protein
MCAAPQSVALIPILAPGSALFVVNVCTAYRSPISAILAMCQWGGDGLTGSIEKQSLNGRSRRVVWACVGG